MQKLDACEKSLAGCRKGDVRALSLVRSTWSNTFMRLSAALLDVFLKRIPVILKHSLHA
jgi:hypothetical protein